MSADFNGTGTGHPSTFGDRHDSSNTANTGDGAWILLGEKAFKTAIFVLAAVNLAAAVIMIANILYDAWTVRNWDFETRKQKYFGWLWRIHPAEMFPLIASGAVVLQSCAVLPVQAINTEPILFDGCVKTVQLIWPAIWIAPITMLVFGLETTFRSLQRTKFSNRNRWHIPIILASIVVLTILLWAVSNVFPTRGMCLTGLIWWTARYFKLAIVICSGMLFSFITSAVIITVQLVKTITIDRAERIAATRVVYYLVANTWIILLVLPFYIHIATNTRAQMAAQMAEIALNLSGMLNFTMHIFLRSNADRLAIRGAETPWSGKRTMRVFGPSDLNIEEHISCRLLWQSKDHYRNSFIAEKLEKSLTESTMNSDYNNYSSHSPLQHAVFPSPTEKRPLTSPANFSFGRQRNNSSYSIFPTTASAQQLHMSTSTTFSNTEEACEMPLPPPPLFAPKHGRNDSGQSRQSSATVQIGLRLSSINNALLPLDPLSPISLHMPQQLTGLSFNANPTRPRLQRASASGDAVNDYAALLAEAYKEVGVEPGTSCSSQAQEVKYTAELAIPQYETSPPESETLSSATFQQPLKQATYPTFNNRPQIAVNTRDIQQRAVGLPKGGKAAPSWRPQNWKERASPNVSPVERVKVDEKFSRKGSSGSNKDLPMMPESAQLDVSPLSTVNPWNMTKPQVIQRPPGWV